MHSGVNVIKIRPNIRKLSVSDKLFERTYFKAFSITRMEILVTMATNQKWAFAVIFCKLEFLPIQLTFKSLLWL